MNIEALIWSHYGKLIIILLFLTVILQSYHMTNLMKLNERHMKERTLDYTHTTHHHNIRRMDLMAYMKKIETAHEMDPSGTYMIVPNIAAPGVSGDNETLTLCSQTTANHLHYLKDLTETWHKPVSVTVFTYGEDLVFALYAIAYMHTCFKTVQSSVRFHLVYPILYPPLHLKSILNMEIHCNNFDGLQNDEIKLNYDLNIPYPHNVLRNVAITNTLTPYILMVDIDMVPSRALSEQFTQFSKRQSTQDSNGNMVYVVPAFESQNYHQLPDKQALINEWGLQNVRPFYKNVCWKCQKVTDYDRWRDLPNLFFMDIGYVLEWEDPWEPFYIAKKENLPVYDGRFKQYGFNRISQVCELHVSGYQFAVLNNVFLVHRGFKEPDKFHHQKDAENDRNRELFRTFKDDLKERYPQSNRQC